MALNLVFVNLREKKTKNDVVNKIKKNRPTFFHELHGNARLQLPCDSIMIRIQLYCVLSYLQKIIVSFLSNGYKI